MSYLLLNSRGLNSAKGTMQICRALKEVGVSDFGKATIYVISLPEYNRVMYTLSIVSFVD